MHQFKMGQTFKMGQAKSNSKHLQASIWVNVVFCMNLHLQSVKTVGIWWHLKWATKSNNTAPCHLNVANLCHTKFQRKNKTDVYSKSTKIHSLQVNLFQKHLFFHQLTHNMTKDCSKNTSSVHEKYKLRTCCVHKLVFVLTF